MLTISLKSMQLLKGEVRAKEKLIKFIETEFNMKLIAETKLNELHFEEIINLYQVYSPKKSNSRGAGRKKTGKQQAICDFALENTHYTITEIANYFGCSRQYVSRVLKENKVLEEYKQRHTIFFE